MKQCLGSSLIGWNTVPAGGSDLTQITGLCPGCVGVAGWLPFCKGQKMGHYSPQSYFCCVTGLTGRISTAKPRGLSDMGGAELREHWQFLGLHNVHVCCYRPAWDTACFAGRGRGVMAPEERGQSGPYVPLSARISAVSWQRDSTLMCSSTSEPALPGCGSAAARSGHRSLRNWSQELK